MADIYLEELDRAIGTVPEPTPAPVVVLFGPFFTLAAQTPNAATYKRIQFAVLEPLVSALGPIPSESEDEPNPKRLVEDTTYRHLAGNACFNDPAEGKVDGLRVKQKVLRTIFEVASQPDTRDSNRRKLYTLWKENCDDSGSN